jgi:hypothetical protein
MIKDIFTQGTFSRGHFYEGYLPERTILQGQNIKDIFPEDQNPGTFRQGHFLKDIHDVIQIFSRRRGRERHRLTPLGAMTLMRY